MTTRDDISLLLVSLGGIIFCAWNLYWGIRNHRTWHWICGVYERRTSPCNYWVAIGAWLLGLTVAIAGFVVLLCKLAV